MFNFYGDDISAFQIISLILYVVLAPFAGGLIAGIDRKVTARMQGRVGPPVLQPFYDVGKLLQKEAVTVGRGAQDFYVMCCLIFMIIAGAFFFFGFNLLMVVFTLTTASIFLVVAGYSSNSPYAQIGAERELLQMMSYEPMVLLTAVGLFMVNGSFNVENIIGNEVFSLKFLPGIFIGYLFIITIKLRKSPFDLSMSHHAHQELVKGLTTEFSGKTLAALEISHWYENIFLLGFIFLFFANGTWYMAVIGIAAVVVCYFLEILIDNGYARMKWQFTLKSAWIMTLIFGGANIFVLYYLRGYLWLAA
ncbi:MAG: NADH-quinone oxidoreductase subunit H [Clostridiales Family XIII bacterium]|jgi:formate hydrogenlyase subunit 4|nr:NADH-quinone oxidoreductase subunit H [Clostridiales Family XIII bacterium]